eukprot:TRINITY_DN2988_c0_g1_i1.p1 TRINITY_DN2988_c0_g1~~TRINITY_DN2988_c0_g1_i1.p1  ORF type:complete len:342 (+),score=84.02 TRINITY_DN2988_c0_g1_i1:143-1027(+)
MALGRTGSLFSALVVRCGCCDGEALAALLRILPAAYEPGCLTVPMDPRQLTGTLLAGTLQDVVLILSRRGVPASLSMSTNARVSPGCLRTTMDDHAEALDDPLLAQCMADYWVVLLARFIDGAVSPQVPETAMLVLTRAVPRTVLTAQPTLVADLVSGVATLNAHSRSPLAASYLVWSLTLLSNLSATAPGHLRRLSDAPAAVTAAIVTVRGTGTQHDVLDASARMALSLYALMAAAGSPSAAAMRAHRRRWSCSQSWRRRKWRATPFWSAPPPCARTWSSTGTASTPGACPRS